MMNALRRFVANTRRPSWSNLLFQAEHEPAAGGPCRWLFCRLLTGGLTIRRQTVAERNSRLRRWHRPSKDLFRGVPVISGVWRFFCRWNYHRRVSGWTAGCAVFKSAPSGREELNRHVSSNRLLRTSAVSDLDVPTTYHNWHKCVS